MCPLVWVVDYCRARSGWSVPRVEEHLLGRMPDVFDPWLTARNANKWLKNKKLGQSHVKKATLDRADFIPYLVEGASSVYGVG